MSDLSNLLGAPSSDLFSGTPFQAAKPPTPPPAPTAAPPDKPREERLIFVGNVPISFKKKAVKKLFSEYGTVEKVWERSVPVDRGKLSIKAACTLGMVRFTQYKEGASSYNCYVLYVEDESAIQALTANGREVEGHHLRVDLACTPTHFTPGRSVFLGNLPYDVSDDAIWKFFEEIGEIDYVRVIRDPRTHEGKGIAYVCFKERMAAKRALCKNNTLFMNRTLRVQRSKEKSDNKNAKNTKTHNAFVNPSKLRNQAKIYHEDMSPEFKPRKRNREDTKHMWKDNKKEMKKLQDKREKRKKDNVTKAKKIKAPRKKLKTQ